MSDPDAHITFKVTGKNGFGADTGDLMLLRGAKELIKSTAFSGGLSSPAGSAPIPTEVYTIRLDIRQTCSKYPWPGDTSDGMHQWYGVEKVDVSEWQWEWGHFRAHLNEHSAKMAQAYRGNFLHGKVRPDDYTHGCICERSEVILRQLWTMKQAHVKVHVVR
ncbi:MAG: hypothetical protein P4L82_20250 [Ancalomicrobiaceae bacterium]|nr:hypothetical protein [Ancalomicrobiaceae bacterium]